MNWYKISKKKQRWNQRYPDERQEGDKIDTQLLSGQFPENRRKDPYKPNKKRNYPKADGNEVTAGLIDTLKNAPKRKGLTNFLNSLGFDENGNRLKFEEPPMTPERKKAKERWYEAEHEHMPA